MAATPFFYKYRFQHILAWMLVAVIWYYLRYQDYPSREQAISITAVKVLDIALLIYTASYILIPRLLYRKKYISFLLVFVSMIVVSSIIKLRIIGMLLHNPKLYDISAANFKLRLYDNVLPHIFLVIAGVAIKLIYDYARMQQRLIEIAKEKAETELQFLKSQINPHFLFNSINSVFFLIDKKNVEARDALHRFSELLRYQLYEMNGSEIPIEKEIKYLQDYVALQKLRKETGYTFEFNVHTDVSGFSIAPLLLIPFVENAFKHLSSFNDRENYVKIYFNFDRGVFNFSIMNTKEQATPAGRSGGIGLANVKRRLALLYPGKHELEIKDEQDTFLVELAIHL